MFKIIKYLYVIVLTLGLLASALLLVVGVCAMADSNDSNAFYEKFIQMYGITADDYGLVMGDRSDGRLIKLKNTAEQSRDSLTDNVSVYSVAVIRPAIVSDATQRRFSMSICMIIVGLISIGLHVIALIGAVKENANISTTMLVLVIIGFFSQFLLENINALAIITDMLFIALLVTFIAMIRKRKAKSRRDLAVVRSNVDQELGAKNVYDEQHYEAVDGQRPPPYDSLEKNAFMA